jgi:hypothetical protein
MIKLPAGRSHASIRSLATVLGAVASCAVALTAAPVSLQAQGAQPFGLQISLLSTSIRIDAGGSSSGGLGIEPQLRFNRLVRSEKGVLSLGVGGQLTSHTSGADEITITGGFLEPRFVPVLPYERVFPYLSGRVAVLNQSSNFGTSSSGIAYGAGGGIAYVLNARVNVDAGVALVRQQFGDINGTRADVVGRVWRTPTMTTYAAKLGVSIGLGQ